MGEKRHIPLAEATGTVEQVMMREPRVHDADAPIDVARAELSNPKVKLLLVCDGPRLVGTVGREQVEGHASAGPVSLGDLAVNGGPRLRPQDSPARALELMSRLADHRVPVVDDEGQLVGLVCWNERHGCFCA
ncbi:MAG TPA: CBS domain-containing protein [Solirubrobacteraceae bacterium]|nr:CBS domain-containing protein [Solirubrobacteraceae bacterium]